MGQREWINELDRQCELTFFPTAADKEDELKMSLKANKLKKMKANSERSLGL